MLQSSDDCEEAEVGDEDTVAVSSLHPNHPGVSHVDVDDSVVVVFVAVGIVDLGLLVVVVSSLQPNHPGVLQVDVDVVVVVELVLVVVPEVVVVSSKHPHQPGVSHVEVRVFVLVVEVEDDVEDVLVLFPVTSFHKGQS